MSRTSRKNISIVGGDKKIYRAAGYIRLSVVKDSRDRDSIENQKSIIRETIEKKGDIVMQQFYIDENATGTSFERDGLQQMMEDIAQGEIDCVVVKDLSRLGRNAVEVGFYVQHLFPEKGVRFLSVIDDFDTLDGVTNISSGAAPGLRIPLVNIFNQEYAADISRKTQASIDRNIREGKCIAARAPYGYTKSSSNCHQLVVDPEAAIVVKEIFAMAEQKLSLNEIVRRLNLAKIPTPAVYALGKGRQGNFDCGDGFWNSRSVKHILTNHTYTGDLQQGKEETVIENTHEALVSRVLFLHIQENYFQTVLPTASPKTPASGNPLKGKVICASCGGKMQRRKGRGNVDWYFFTCITNNRKGCGCSTGMYIREPEILNAIRMEAAQELGVSHLSSTELNTVIQNQLTEVTIYKNGQIDVHFNLQQKRCRQ